MAHSTARPDSDRPRGASVTLSVPTLSPAPRAPRPPVIGSGDATTGEGSMKVTVLGAGSWGTTVAALSAPRNPTTLWARSAEVAGQIDADHTNPGYLPGFVLPPRLRATADLEAAVTDADLLVVGVPSAGFRAVLEEARPWVRP